MPGMKSERAISNQSSAFSFSPSAFLLIADSCLLKAKAMQEFFAPPGMTGRRNFFTGDYKL